MNPILALILANVIWGFAIPIYKLVLDDIPPFAFTFIRFSVAALVFLREKPAFTVYKEFPKQKEKAEFIPRPVSLFLYRQLLSLTLKLTHPI